MEDRSSTSNPVNSSSQSSSSDLKSPTGSSRPLYSSKLGDPKGRASETNSPSPTTRQPPVPKAWTSAKNPIIGRTNTQQSGVNSPSKPSLTASLREGQRVRITLTSGAVFEGIYANHPTDSASCSLRMVQQKKLPNSGEITNGRREQSNMSFQRKDITDARTLPGNAGKVDGKANGNRSSFRTDTAISNSRAGAERVLKPWVPDSSDEIDGSLEKSTSGGHWDQFAENERLFGVKTDYDESIYTTTIDKSHPQYRERMAAAERKAREIERSTTNNSHVAEERVMDFVGGKDNADEEDKYSGVRRDQKSDFPPLGNRENKYTPPARRAPAGATTVKGAPVDPAIIFSSLKSTTAQKPAAPKSEESKSPVPSVGKGPATPTTDAKPAETKADGKASEANAIDSKTPEAKAPEAKAPEAKASEAKAADKTATPLRPAATNSRTLSPQGNDSTAAPSATSTVERDVLNSFKNFATQQRMNAEKVRSNKAKADKEIKLTELKKFAESFKLSTPVPKDLVSIIAKDPAKQKQIQEKARANAEEIAKTKAAESTKVKEPASASSLTATEPKPKPATEAPASSTTAAAVDQRAAAPRPAPAHGNAQTGVPSRHPGPRNSYNPQQQHYNGYNRPNNRQPSHLGQTQQTGNLGSRLRANQHNQKLDHQHQHQPPQHPHVNQHLPPHPPTGPANSVDAYGRRLSGVPPTQPHAAAHLQPKLNPNSTEFRPNAFAPSFNPGSVHPSQSSSPRSSANNVAGPHSSPTPVQGQLIRRKTKAINTKKCFILGHIQSIAPPAGRSWEENDGLRPSFDTHPTWRQLNDETDKPGSTMHLTYKEYFEQLPISSAALATPNPTHVVPNIPHQHQLPFHMQHGVHNGPPRQSPHMPPMQMHTGPGPVPHVPFNPDDHRMVPSHSAQSYASPRMGQIPMAYPPTPSQMPYNQPVMPQQYVNPGTPQMNQFRSFSNNPQFVPQHPPNMGNPIMIQPHFMPGPNGMVAGPQVPMYSGGHPQFLPPGGGPPQSMPGTNGYPSPSRPVAPMMAHQGSHQGYGMSPAMGYQQPVYTPQQPGVKFQPQRPPQ